MARPKTNLELVKETDSFPNETTDPAAYEEATQHLYTWVVSDRGNVVPVGFMLPAVVEQITALPEELRGEVGVQPHTRTITAFAGPAEEDRSKKIAKVTDYWREQRTFTALSKWRNELFPVYSSESDLAYNIERAACGLFGINTFGVHLTAFVRCKDSSYGLKIWVPTRAATKSSFPGMLDNTVAGGLTAGEDPLECVIREADEEASLPEALVRSNAVPCGTVTYITITDERSGGESGLICPECEWIYDLELPADVIPKPKDGEVESFNLCTVEEIKEELGRGRFKPNCASVMLDFFIRHGIITKETEEDFDEINRHLHRPLPFPGPQGAGTWTRWTN
ncbi:related to thiamin pyrophosphokinase [Cephalotrichum gorgonifer]|uniref:Related to thiamin pyrophosphokinase n=1 Tax=Cephalotrichum gorgonifer TaxID=2041049 RepID=A0AAE8SVE2_9PEZI|nr:related to thiamin pyrophosphokinase [Cephalotrichum gorgonifer]